MLSTCAQLSGTTVKALCVLPHRLDAGDEWRECRDFTMRASEVVDFTGIPILKPKPKP